MNIVYAANDLYAPLLGVSLTSLLENNNECENYIYILSNGIAETNIDKFMKMEQIYRCKLHILDISKFQNNIDFDIDTCGYNITTMARLFLANILPSEVDKVIYLDCDTMINDNIIEFWNIDIENSYIAGVPEFLMPAEKKIQAGLNADSMYYNAGVLLINLRKWRDENIIESFLNYYKAHNGMLQYNDQDIINYCCVKQSKEVNFKFDYFPILRWYRPKFISRVQPLYAKYSKTEILQIQKKPAIVHFVGDERPWVLGNHVAYKREYIRYEKKSLWCDAPFRIKGKQILMQIYFACNLMALIFPKLRMFIGKSIGINKAKIASELSKKKG